MELYRIWLIGIPCVLAKQLISRIFEAQKFFAGGLVAVGVLSSRVLLTSKERLE